jgi:serine protease AprX
MNGEGAPRRPTTARDMSELTYRVLRASLLGLFVCLSPGATDLVTAQEPDPRIFAGKAARETASFLVVMRQQADLSGAGFFAGKAEKGRFVFEALSALAEQTQRPLRASLDAAGIRYRSFYLLNMIEVAGDRSLARELAARDDVSSLAPNPEVRREPEPVIGREPEAALDASRSTPDATSTVEPNIAKVGAPDVWSRGFTGQGIVVGMADTGVVWDHPALKSHYRGFDGTAASHDYNWHDAVHDAAAGNPCGSDAPAPCDDEGHGTSTASLVVGDDGSGNQVGMAPGARFIACRNMDQGTGTPARYTECFQFFLAPTDHNGANPRPDLAAHVINNSWDCPASEGCTDPNVLKAIVENLRAAGIAAVFSAGNSGPACATISDVPASYDASFTVAATSNSDTIAIFSSRGPITVDGSNRLKPDISAPGVGLRVASFQGGYQSGFSGTSGSAPHVAGAIALLWSAAPPMIGQVPATEDLLKSTAVPLTSTQDCGSYSGGAVPNAVFGSGRLNASAAVNAAAPPPASFYTLTPCRVGDTRDPEGSSGGPALAAASIRNFPVAGICGIPPSATAVAINLAVAFPTNGGDLRVYPAGSAAPLASAINFRPGIVRANNATIRLGAGGQISVQCDMPSGLTNFFFDVYGYFQ